MATDPARFDPNQYSDLRRYGSSEIYDRDPNSPDKWKMAFQIQDARPYYDRLISDLNAQLQARGDQFDTTQGLEDEEYREIAARLAGTQQLARMYDAGQEDIRARGGQIVNPALSRISPQLGTMAMPYNAAMSYAQRVAPQTRLGTGFSQQFVDQASSAMGGTDAIIAAVENRRKQMEKAKAEGMDVSGYQPGSYDRSSVQIADPSLRSLGYQNQSQVDAMFAALNRMRGLSAPAATGQPSDGGTVDLNPSTSTTGTGPTATGAEGTIDLGGGPASGGGGIVNTGYAPQQSVGSGVLSGLYGAAGRVAGDQFTQGALNLASRTATKLPVVSKAPIVSKALGVAGKRVPVVSAAMAISDGMDRMNRYEGFGNKAAAFGEGAMNSLFAGGVDALQAALPKSWGGQGTNETDEQYFARTGRIADPYGTRQAMGNFLSNIFGVGDGMTDADRAAEKRRRELLNLSRQVTGA
jgi:hypothetical protein